MTPTNKLRIATPDTAGAISLACSTVASAAGLPVHVEYQEVEGTCVILELRLGKQADHTAHTRLARKIDRAPADVEVLSVWEEAVTTSPPPKYSRNVLGVLYDDMPPVAHRALKDNLPTAQWDRSDASWHLAVPSVCATQPIVGLSHRRGYTHRFTSLDAAAIQCGLAS